MNLGCPFCGSTFTANLEYTARYSDHRDLTGYECDNYACDARWDKNGNLTRPSKHATQHVYTLSTRPKSLRETVNIARGIVARHPEESHEPFHSRVLEHLDLLGAECDRKRPTGVGGKHGDLHTSECGCG